MFPDVYEEGNLEGESSAVGIVIADDTPFNIEGNKNCLYFFSSVGYLMFSRVFILYYLIIIW